MSIMRLGLIGLAYLLYAGLVVAVLFNIPL